MMQVRLFIHSYMNLCDHFSWLWKCSPELAVCISISVDKYRVFLSQVHSLISQGCFWMYMPACLHLVFL